MDEERFNIDVRRFLKRFGISAQREIENAVHDALRRGQLEGTEVLDVHATLRIVGLAGETRVEGRVALEGPSAEPEPK